MFWVARIALVAGLAVLQSLATAAEAPSAVVMDTGAPVGRPASGSSATSSQSEQPLLGTRRNPAAPGRGAEGYRRPEKPALSGSAYEVFFSDYVLFSAQEEVLAMDTIELSVLADMIRKCSGRNTAAPDPALQHGCGLERSRFIFAFDADRQIDRLVAASQFMAALADYNRVIGRQPLGGTDDRMSTIHNGLSAAVQLARGGYARRADAGR